MDEKKRSERDVKKKKERKKSREGKTNYAHL